MAFQSQSRDVPQVMLSVLFLALMIIACLWIVQPFILGFARQVPWLLPPPVLLRVQRALFGRRSLAVIVMTLLLILLFILPVALLVNSPVDNSGPVIQAITSGEMTPPTTGG